MCSAMAYILLAGVLGLAFAALQLLLMQRVMRAESGVKRGLLLALKVPLWAIAFIGIALWWGITPLLAFGLAAGGMYLAVAIVYFVRTRRREHRKGE